MSLFLELSNKSRALLVRVAKWYLPSTLRERGVLWASGVFSITALVLLYILGIYWSQEPERFAVTENAKQKAGASELVPGYVFSATLYRIAETLLEKPGGYLSNDKLPPTSLFGAAPLLDNIPNWEFGALILVRDTARVLRNDFSRSQSQSLENVHLSEAEPKFNFDNGSWLFPPTENEYQSGLKHLGIYLEQLQRKDDPNSQFFTRADNLNELLSVVEKRLGSYSKRLNASVEETRVNTDLAGDPEATQATLTPGLIVAKTSWLEIDDVFYESRGYVWALLHILLAVEQDFDPVLRKKNAISSLQQVINLLEQSLTPPASPIVLNGDPMGWMANYSKGMVSYISPANAAIIDLRNLLKTG